MARASGLSLGVHWYLHEDEERKTDGKFTSYLTGQARYRNVLRRCDEELHQTLYELVTSGNRRVAAVRESGVLGENTPFFEEMLTFERRSSREDRCRRREVWLESALRTTGNAQIVFMDPDNSISRSKNPLLKEGLKHVFINDVRRFIDSGKSVVICHHLGRKGKHRQQICCWAQTLRDELEVPDCAMRYRRGTSRAFFIPIREEHTELLDCRLDAFATSSWIEEEHFDIVEWHRNSVNGLAGDRKRRTQ